VKTIFQNDLFWKSNFFNFEMKMKWGELYEKWFWPINNFRKSFPFGVDALKLGKFDAVKIGGDEAVGLWDVEAVDLWDDGVVDLWDVGAVELAVVRTLEPVGNRSLFNKIFGWNFAIENVENVAKFQMKSFRTCLTLANINCTYIILSLSQIWEIWISIVELLKFNEMLSKFNKMVSVETNGMHEKLMQIGSQKRV
jgi:hypothetical protein